MTIRPTEMLVVKNTKTILFTCCCGNPLAALILGPGPRRAAEIRFYTRTEPYGRVERCPQCDRDFSAVTVDEFLNTVWG